LRPFSKEIEWFASTDITGGYPDGTYHPTGPVTRRSLAAFVQRYDALWSRFAASPIVTTTEPSS
jgi:hypothetical protein